MPFLISFLWLLTEIWLFTQLVPLWGFGLTLLAYFGPSLLGFFMLSFQSRSALLQLQKNLSQGREPGRELLSMAAIFLGVLALLPPFLGPRVFAVILLFPPTRWLLLAIFRTWVVQRLSRGAVHVFQTRWGGAGMGAGFGFPAQPPEREAGVVDVEAKRLEGPAVAEPSTDQEAQRSDAEALRRGGD